MLEPPITAVRTSDLKSLAIRCETGLFTVSPPPKFTSGNGIRTVYESGSPDRVSGDRFRDGEVFVRSVAGVVAARLGVAGGHRGVGVRHRVEGVHLDAATDAEVDGDVCVLRGGRGVDLVEG